MLSLTPVTASGSSEDISFAENLETFHLDNGMQVVVIPDHRAPVVTHMLWYKAGSADDPIGQSGIAHFFEHLMFSGTKSHPDSEFSDWVSSVGGQENAQTSYDYTAYYQRLSKQHLAKTMAYEADRMRNLTLSDDIIERERKVVLEERNMRVENNPSALLGEAMDAALYEHHPYRIPIIGWRHEIESVTKEQLLAFYNRYYWPNNAVLIVAGDISVDEVRQIAQQTYGKIGKNEDLQERQRAQEPPAKAWKFVEYEDEKAGQPYLIRRYKVTSNRLAEDDSPRKLELAAKILGSGSSSRLYQELVIKKKIATDAGAYYSPSRYDNGSFTIYGVPNQDIELSDLEAAIEKVLADFIEKGITENELAMAKQTLIDSSLFSLDSQESLVRIFGRALMTGSSIDAVKKWDEEIKKIDKDGILAAIKEQLQKKASVTGYLIKSKDKKNDG